MKRTLSYILLLLVTLMTAAYGQDIQKPIKSSRAGEKRTASRYIFTPGADALMITVKVWGEVRQPGVYEVPIGVDLIELLSSAGGPTNNAKLSNVKIISSHLEEGETQVLTVDVKEFLNTGNSDLIPIIQPDDTIVVPVKPTQYVLTSLSWTQQAINLVSMYALIQYYLSR